MLSVQVGREADTTFLCCGKKECFHKATGYDFLTFLLFWLALLIVESPYLWMSV